MFRDESSHIIHKVETKARRRSTAQGGGQLRKNIKRPATPALPISELLSASSPYPKTPVTLTSSSEHTPGALPIVLLLRDSPWSKSEIEVSVHASKPLPSLITSNSHGSPLWSSAHSESLLPSPDSDDYPRKPHIAAAYSISPCYQEQGIAFFFSKFVNAEANSCSHQFNFIYDVLKPVNTMSDKQVDGLISSITAVGLAGLSRIIRSPDMLKLARKSYGTALKLTNMALKNKEEVLKDTTMLSVLVLGIFEIVVDTQKPLAWYEHINGAATLAKMRGPQQFRTLAGIKMFLMLNYNVIISCLIKALPMPPALIELRRYLPQLFFNQETLIAGGDREKARKLWQTEMFASEPLAPINKLLQVRCDLINGTLSDTAERVRRLFEVEQDFESWFQRFPDTWRYQVVRIKKPNPAVLGELCHTYTSLQHATVWSGIRSSRFLLLETLFLELLKGFQSNPSFFTTLHYLKIYCRTLVMLKRLINSIVRSTPFVLCKITSLDSQPQHFVSIPATVLVREPSICTPTSWSSCRGGNSVRSSPRKVSYSHGQKNTKMLLPLPPQPQSLPEIHYGPTLLDPAASGTLSIEESQTRLHMLASAKNAMLIPLYFAGMSIACSGEVKQYVVERLGAMWRENGIEQAREAAVIVDGHDLSVGIGTSGADSLIIRLPTPELRDVTHKIQKDQEIACAKLLI